MAEAASVADRLIHRPGALGLVLLVYAVIGLGRSARSSASSPWAHLLADILTDGIRPFAPVPDTESTLDVVRAANPLTVGVAVAIGVALLGRALGGG